MEKEESIVNEDLNTAFVEGELNKTLTAEESSNWNLLDDPNILEEEPNANLSHILSADSRSTSKTHKSGLFMESTIKFQEKYSSNANYATRPAEDDDDIKDLFAEMTKGRAKGKK